MENKVVIINKYINEKLINENFDSYNEVKEKIVELISDWSVYLSNFIDKDNDTSFIEEFEYFLEDMNSDSIKKALENKYET